MTFEIIESFISSHGEISFIDHGGYESRSESTIMLFNEAFNQIKDKMLFRPTHFFIDVGDVSENINGELTFGYTDAMDVIPCPDFCFDKWIECGISNYGETINRILDSGEKKYSVEKLFWTGNPDTQPLRYDLLKLGSLHNDKMEIIPMEWNRVYPKGTMHNYTLYTSLEDHTRYKYLIDCGASGYSARMKFLLHSNRPLFLVDREDSKKEYFYNSLIPFVHFIPVKKDLSDLMKQLEWAENNDAKASDIANNARQFAIQNLNKKTAIDYLSDIIQQNCGYS